MLVGVVEGAPHKAFSYEIAKTNVGTVTGSEADISHDFLEFNALGVS